MICTDRQYDVTCDRVRRFGRTLSALADDEAGLLRNLQEQSIRDQIETLRAELAEFEDLTSGDERQVEVDRLADLPAALVRGRLIAGYDQDTMASIAGLDATQLKRWERNGYSRAPVAAMEAVAALLPVVVAEGILTRPGAAVAPVRRAMIAAGLPGEVFDRIVMPADVAAYATGDDLDQRLAVLFGNTAAAFVSAPRFETTTLRFKLPASAAQDRTRAYAAYVDGLCRMAVKTQYASTTVLPKTWSAMRTLIFPDGAITLENAIGSCWRLGIGVIGLDDRVAFHGACRRSAGRATIVLKQPSRYASRWLFDLLHELFHLVADDGDFTLLEGDESSAARRLSNEEVRANRFAAMILTDGRYVGLMREVIERSRGDARAMRRTVIAVARENDVPVGVFANLVAGNIAEGDRTSTWWATAAALQDNDDDPWKTVRDGFIRHADLAPLTSLERSMVERLLETRDD